MVERLSSNGGKAQYDPKTGIIQASDAMQRRRFVRLDPSGFVDEVRSASGRSLKLTNDRSGRTTKILEASGQETEFVYDADSQVAAVIRNGTQLCQLTWSEDRSQCAARYWDGSVARATFDSEKNPLRLTNRLGASDAFKYDSNGRLRELTNGRGESTHFELSAEGLPIVTTHVDGRRESVLAYDDMGNPTAVANDGELTFTASYNAPGRPATVTYVDGSEYQFERDNKGRILAAVGPTSQTTFIYNDHGLPVEETTNGKTFRFEYDATDLLVALEYPDGSRVSFTYDEDKRIATCTDWQGGTTHFTYDVPDRTIARRTPNDLTQHAVLHSCGKAERIAITGPQGNVLADSQFAYDTDLRLAARIDVGGERRDFVYDAESQLLGVHSRQQWLEHYAYDPAGNRSASHWGSTVVAPGNRITRQGLDSFEYDARGNVSNALVAGEAWRFEYDLRNQLVAAHGPRGSVRFQYDALGRRTAKISATKRVQYVWCAEQVTQEIITTAAGVETRDYLYMPSTYQPLALRSGGKCYYFHNSPEGTPERISDANGEFVWSARYDAFGHAQVEIAQIDNPIRFAGQQYDAETGLHYNRFRYYSPRLGRYWSVDPIGLRGDHNLYCYVGNDPINRVDPLGLWWKTALSVAAGVVAAVGVAALVVATAPVSLPALAIGALAVTAGAAVGFGVNEALTVDHFCALCLAKGFAKGVVFGAGAVVAIGVAALVGETAAIVVTAGFIAYGLYSTANLVFHWDNMTHEQRMEAIGGALGGVAVGLGLAGTGGIPPGTGLAPALTPEGVVILVPAEGAAVAAGPAAAAAQGAAMSGSGDGSGGGEEEEEAQPEDDSESARQQAVEDRMAELEQEGHGPQRHGPEVTEQQLKDRAQHGVDPMTGTTTDGETGGTHMSAKTASKVNRADDYVSAEQDMRNSPEFEAARKQAEADGNRKFELRKPLEEVYGPDYESKVSGFTRNGPKTPPGTAPTTPPSPADFTGGDMVLRAVQKPDGTWVTKTMYPDTQ
ncbi:MAG: RHS repeat-associated core domain-containing protein [Polyangiaceae bacterium]